MQEEQNDLSLLAGVKLVDNQPQGPAGTPNRRSERGWVEPQIAVTAAAAAVVVLTTTQDDGPENIFSPVSSPPDAMGPLAQQCRKPH